jgi:hypothetical protein
MRKYMLLKKSASNSLYGWYQVKVMLKPGLGWYRMIGTFAARLEVNRPEEAPSNIS